MDHWHPRQLKMMIMILLPFLTNGNAVQEATKYDERPSRCPIRLVAEQNGILLCYIRSLHSMHHFNLLRQIPGIGMIL